MFVCNGARLSFVWSRYRTGGNAMQEGGSSLLKARMIQLRAGRVTRRTG